jgi:two-component system LytT family sensor kinase
MTEPSPGIRNKLPSFWTIQLAGWVVYFVAIYITFLTVAQPGNFLSLFLLKGFRAVTGFFLTSLFLRPIYRKFGDRLSLGGSVVLVLLCSVVFGLAWTWIEAGYVYLNNPAFSMANFLPRSPRIALDYAMTLTAWSALYLGVQNWLSWQEEREKALRSSALADKAQLEMLRYQINPHFLFNALNSIRASVDEDAGRAKRMITQLSEFLRYSLLHEGEKLTTLREEVEAVRNYLAIEKIRFEEKLDVRYEIDARAEDFQLPGFLLNPLVENAVKHGSGNGGPLRIELEVHANGDGLAIEVRNTGALKDGDINGNGIGLANVRERLERQFGPRGRFDISQRKGDVVARIEVLDAE